MILADPRIPSIGVPLAVTIGTTSTLIWSGDLENAIGVTVTNTCGQFVFLSLGTPATLTSFTRALPPAGYWQLPASWVGQLYGVSAMINGSVVLTVFRPGGYSGPA